MLFPNDVYEPEAVANMGRAYDAAWREFSAARPRLVSGGHVIRKLMALRILEAAHRGEHDLHRLKAIALRAVDGRHFD
jgi:hypothetical protein